jgi:hypothetical protein
VLQSIALLSLLLVGAIVFGDFRSVAGQDYALKFICIPIAVWVAFEFRPREEQALYVLLAATPHRAASVPRIFDSYVNPPD